MNKGSCFLWYKVKVFMMWRKSTQVETEPRYRWAVYQLCWISCSGLGCEPHKGGAGASYPPWSKIKKSVKQTVWSFPLDLLFHLFTSLSTLKRRLWGILLIHSLLLFWTGKNTLLAKLFLSSAIKNFNMWTNPELDSYKCFNSTNPSVSSRGVTAAEGRESLPPRKHCRLHEICTLVDSSFTPKDGHWCSTSLSEDQQEDTNTRQHQYKTCGALSEFSWSAGLFEPRCVCCNVVIKFPDALWRTRSIKPTTVLSHVSSSLPLNLVSCPQECLFGLPSPPPRDPRHLPS